jgi:hypothetical protein
MITAALLVLATSGALATPDAPAIQRPGASSGAPLVQRPGQAKPAPAPAPAPVAAKAAPVVVEPTPVVEAAPAPELRPAVAPAAAAEPARTPEEIPVVEPAPELAQAELAAPVVQRPKRQKAMWSPFDDADLDVPPSPSWTPFDDPDGPRIVPPSLLARFEPAALERPVIRANQMWEDEDAPIVANPDLGRHSRKWRRSRRWR